jgi:hypothetical protein
MDEHVVVLEGGEGGGECSAGREEGDMVQIYGCIDCCMVSIELGEVTKVGCVDLQNMMAGFVTSGYGCFFLQWSLRILYSAQVRWDGGTLLVIAF